MIVANMSNNQTLGAFHLALFMKAYSRSDSPSQNLVEHFNVLVSQVKSLLNDSTGKEIDLLPEAVDLALQINDADLQEDFKGISLYEDISADQARKIIDSIQLAHAN